MEILATIWEIIKVLLIAITAMGLITAIIAVLHPLRFDLKLRGSIRGQRGEFWFVYLFRIVKIGVIATPHTQDVILKFLFWEKILNRQQRTRPPAPDLPSGSDGPVAPPPASETTSDSVGSEKAATENAADNVAQSRTEKSDKEIPEPEKYETAPSTPASDFSENLSTEDIPESAPEPESETHEPLKTVSASTTDIPSEITSPAAVTETTEPDSITGQENSDTPDQTDSLISDSMQQQASTEKNESIEDAEPIKPSEIDAAPLKPLKDVERDQQTKAESSTEQPDKSNIENMDAKGGWRTNLRKFKKDFSRRYRQIKGYLRLFRIKYRVLFPVVKRFFRRGRAAFSLHNPSLMLRYSLHEHYLTGMMQGNLAIAAGMAGKFGVNFVPIPVFSQPGVYAKGMTSAIIRPWRLVFAMIGLLFELSLYKELYQAIKWYLKRRREN